MTPKPSGLTQPSSVTLSQSVWVRNPDRPRWVSAGSAWPVSLVWWLVLSAGPSWVWAAMPTAGSICPGLLPVLPGVPEARCVLRRIREPYIFHDLTSPRKPAAPFPAYSVAGSSDKGPPRSWEGDRPHLSAKVCPRNCGVADGMGLPFLDKTIGYTHEWAWSNTWICDSRSASTPEDPPGMSNPAGCSVLQN